MKAFVQDSKALSAINPLEVMAYLRSKGWQRVAEKEDWTAWVFRDRNDEEVELALPTDSQPRDFARRMSDVLFGLEVVEERSQLDILKDLYVANSDVVRIRLADEELSDGTLPLEEGARLFQKARDLMFAAASSAVTPKAIFAGRRSLSASDFLNKTRFGQTEQGSFIITIVSKVPPNLAAAAQPAGTVEEPFARKVTQTLATALNAVRLSSQRAAATGEVESFVAAVDQGVSANLCDALVGMAESADADRTLDFDFSWSATRPNPIAEGRSKIHLPRGTFPVLQSASRYFKEHSPREDFTIEGAVVGLKKEANETTGKVTIMSQIDDKMRRVVLELPEVDYSRAVIAHDQKKSVKVDGVLVREGRTFHLNQVSSFEVDPEANEQE